MGCCQGKSRKLEEHLLFQHGDIEMTLTTGDEAAIGGGDAPLEPRLRIVPDDLTVQDRLVAACVDLDLLSASAAIADGANVNDVGSVDTKAGRLALLPLAAVVPRAKGGYSDQCLEVAALLLYHGADPNLGEVLHTCATFGEWDLLLLLLDAGGDVNHRRAIDGQPLLVTALNSRGHSRDCVGLVEGLLRQPALDLTLLHNGKPMECCTDNSDVARRVADEVSEGCHIVTRPLTVCPVTRCLCLWYPTVCFWY